MLLILLVLLIGVPVNAEEYELGLIANLSALEPTREIQMHLLTTTLERVNNDSFLLAANVSLKWCIFDYVGTPADVAISLVQLLGFQYPTQSENHKALALFAADSWDVLLPLSVWGSFASLYKVPLFTLDKAPDTQAVYDSSFTMGSTAFEIAEVAISMMRIWKWSVAAVVVTTEPTGVTIGNYFSSRSTPQGPFFSVFAMPREKMNHPDGVTNLFTAIFESRLGVIFFCIRRQDMEGMLRNLRDPALLMHRQLVFIGGQSAAAMQKSPALALWNGVIALDHYCGHDVAFEEERQSLGVSKDILLESDFGISTAVEWIGSVIKTAKRKNWNSTLNGSMLLSTSRLPLDPLSTSAANCNFGLDRRPDLIWRMYCFVSGGFELIGNIWTSNATVTLENAMSAKIFRWMTHPLVPIDLIPIPYAELGAKFQIPLLVSNILALIASAYYMFKIVVNRKHPVIRSSTPSCMVLILTGSIILYLLAISNAVGSQELPCLVNPYVFNLGFVLVIAPLVFKTYRLHLIFNSPQLRTYTIPTSLILVSVFGIVLIESCVFVAWWVVDQPKRVISKTLRGGDLISTCDYQFYWLSVILASKAMMIAFLVRLGYSVRSLQEQYNESRSIMYAAFVSVFMACIATPLYIYFKTDLEVSLMMFCLGICMGNCWSMFVLVQPKLELLGNSRQIYGLTAPHLHYGSAHGRWVDKAES